MAETTKTPLEELQEIEKRLMRIRGALPADANLHGPVFTALKLTGELQRIARMKKRPQPDATTER